MVKKNKQNLNRQIVVREKIVRPIAKRRRAPRKARRTSRMSGIVGYGSEDTFRYACSINDPFECSSCIPDGSNGTGCFSSKQQYTLNVAALGSTTSIFLGCNNLQTFAYTDVGNATAVPIVTGFWAIGAPMVLANQMYSASRIVSAGLRATYIGNTQTDQGIILVGQYPANLPGGISFFNGKTITQAANGFMNYKIYPLRNGAQITWRPENELDVITWDPLINIPVAVATVQTNPGIAILCFATQPNAGILSVEACVNFEGQYQLQTFLAGGMNSVSTPAAEIGWYEKAKALLRGTTAILPYVASGISTIARPMLREIGRQGAQMLGSMANGYPAPGQLGQQAYQGQKLLTYR